MSDSDNAPSIQEQVQRLSAEQQNRLPLHGLPEVSAPEPDQRLLHRLLERAPTHGSYPEILG
jgi:hypothetical protein